MVGGVFTRLLFSRAFRESLQRKTYGQIYGTLLKECCGILGSVRWSFLSLARGQRIHILLPVR